MLSIETAFAFFIASSLLALAPGPDNVFVLTQSALHGRVSGLVVMAGLCTGLLVHTCAVAFGVAVIFQASAAAFLLLKICGAGYLLFLAWQTFRSNPAKIDLRNGQRGNHAALYRRGIIMNITNPKVSIFFLAFLPQFTDPQRGPIATQMIALGGVFIVSTVIIFSTVALVGGTLGQWLNSSLNRQKVMNRIAGTVFVGLALKLIATER